MRHNTLINFIILNPGGDGAGISATSCRAIGLFETLPRCQFQRERCRAFQSKITGKLKRTRSNSAN
jgi:hypothetical protein